jgi:hypothetical protein
MLAPGVRSPRVARRLVAVAVAVAVAACGGDDGGPPAPLPVPACAAAAVGSPDVAAPVLAYTLADRWHEGWLASPAVVDLDGDGGAELVVPRDELLVVWRIVGGTPVEVWRADTGGRIWAAPVVVDLVPGRPGLEVAVASRGSIFGFDAGGAPLPGFPFAWRDELRSLAAGDVDGDGALELVAVTTTPLDAGGQRDIVIAVERDGRPVAGFPPNTGGAAGCDDACYVTGGYDQNLGLGDVDGDHRVDIIAAQDNAYVSAHDGTGRALAAAPIFSGRTKYSGIRMMLDYRLAQQGYADDEAVDLQGHFTNTGPALADLDGDGTAEIILLGSVQNAAQDQREHGVALGVIGADGTRPDPWLAPPHFADYRAGLRDFGDNVVAATNQVAVADLDPARPGPELVFAGFDGRIHAVDARAQVVWARDFAQRDDEVTGGVVVADLSGDGVPELVFATYSAGGGRLIVLDAAGSQRHALDLPGRGAMPVPTLGDVDGDGAPEIVVSLKDGEDRVRQTLIYRVPGASSNCLVWPTGRGNYRRDGYLPPG